MGRRRGAHREAHGRHGPRRDGRRGRWAPLCGDGQVARSACRVKASAAARATATCLIVPRPTDAMMPGCAEAAPRSSCCRSYARQGMADDAKTRTQDGVKREDANLRRVPDLSVGQPGSMMPPSPLYRPSTRHAELGEAFYDVVAPARFPAHVLRYRNQRWAARVGLDDADRRRVDRPFRPLRAAARQPSAAAGAALPRPPVPGLQPASSATAAASCSRSSTTASTAACSTSAPRAAARRRGRAAATGA